MASKCIQTGKCVYAEAKRTIGDYIRDSELPKNHQPVDSTVVE